MQKFFCIGNLTRAPEASTTPSGVSVCRFSIAVNRDFANTNGEKEADFFNVVTWRGVADNCGKYLKKGNKVAIIGKLQNRTFEAQDGSKRTVTEIIAEHVEFLTTKSGGEQATKTNITPVEDDELPF